MSFFNTSAARMIINSSNKVGCIFQKSLMPTSALLSPLNSTAPVRTLNRSLVVLSTPNKPPTLMAVNPSTMCACGCGINGMHTRGDRELVEFLQDEIASEKKTQSGGGKVPAKLDDFSVKADGSEIVLTKSFQDEEIKIKLNINHTVESDAPEEHEDAPKEGGEEIMKSRPDFEVDVTIGGKTMSFTCQFMPPTGAAEGEQPEDSFGVNEITFFEGKHGDTAYAVAGEILDGMLYDLLMNYLEERGVSNDFAEKLSTFCTQYEQSQYIGLLENMHSFVKRK